MHWGHCHSQTIIPPLQMALCFQADSILLTCTKSRFISMSDWEPRFITPENTTPGSNGGVL